MENADINIWLTFNESTVICFENTTKYKKAINNLPLNIKCSKNYKIK